MKNSPHKRLRAILPIQIFVICILSCNDDIPTDRDAVYNYVVPTQTDDGWEVASLSDKGMDELPMFSFMHEILNHVEHKIHGILIIKKGKLVFEEYFPGFAFYHGPLKEFSLETTHNIASVTKSFTSTLIGLAIDQEYITSVDQKMISFFPEYEEPDDERNDYITLEHVLTMTSGLEWDESTYPYTDSRNDVAQMLLRSDPIAYILNKPLLTEPGTHFVYSSGSSILLGEIIRRATGLRADEFAEKYLFSPLGVTDYTWVELSNDVLFTSGDLKLRPRDMAKLGALFLQNGQWEGKQIISRSWIERSTESFVSAMSNWNYGYNWWLYTYEYYSEQIESYSASGWGGQNIIIFPTLDMIVVTTAGYYDDPQQEFHIDILMMQKVLESALNDSAVFK